MFQVKLLRINYYGGKQYFLDHKGVEPAANVMSSFYAQSEWELKKKFSAHYNCDSSSSHQHQTVSDYIVWLSGKRSRTGLERRGVVTVGSRTSPLWLQLQTATLRADSRAKVFPNDGWKSPYKTEYEPWSLLLPAGVEEAGNSRS